MTMLIDACENGSPTPAIFIHHPQRKLYEVYYARCVGMPRGLVFSLSVSLLTSALMGGSGTLFGPLVGSVILNLIPTVFASLHDYHLYIYAGIILVTIVFLPKGIVGSLRQMPALRRLRRQQSII